MLQAFPNAFWKTQKRSLRKTETIFRGKISSKRGSSLSCESLASKFSIKKVLKFFMAVRPPLAVFFVKKSFGKKNNILIYCFCQEKNYHLKDYFFPFCFNISLTASSGVSTILTISKSDFLIAPYLPYTSFFIHSKNGPQ